MEAGKDGKHDALVSVEVAKVSSVSAVGGIPEGTVLKWLEDWNVPAASVNLSCGDCPEWVARARLLTALARTFPELKIPVPLSVREGSRRDRPRRSRLYMAADRPHFLLKAPDCGADAVIFDLEDAVGPSEKDAARIMAAEALAALDLGDVEAAVRINPLPDGFADLDMVVPAGVQMILVPKCTTADDVRKVARRVEELGERYPPGREVLLMPIIESALGVENAMEIAGASGLVVAVSMGLEDYTFDMGVERTREGRESLWARARVANAAAACGVQASDSVFSDIGDLVGLRESIREARSLGYVGKGCIHPNQVPIVNSGFSPSDDEISNAMSVVKAFRSQGGAALLGTRMIDAPVVKRAHGTIERAIAAGKLPADWEE